MMAKAKKSRKTSRKPLKVERVDWNKFGRSVDNVLDALERLVLKGA